MGDPVLPYKVVAAGNGLAEAGVDGIIFVSSQAPGSAGPPLIREALKNASQFDNSFSTRTQVVPLPCDGIQSRRLIVSPVKLLTDYDDERSFHEAANKGMIRAIKSGVTKPLIFLPKEPKFKDIDLVVVLGALQALYVPIQVREDAPGRKHNLVTVFVCHEDGSNPRPLIEMASALESGLYVSRDIGGGDPERMAAPAVEEYVRNLFNANSGIKVTTVSDEAVLAKEYPLFAAVNRAASVIERHKGRIIYLTYEPSSPPPTTLYLVGKGITYDTGGADVKISGAMAGMSRDKCGAAAVAGFFKVLALLQPSHIRVVGAMCLARNSIGENSYVSDEVITARSKARVRVSNTDAEGRMVMADVLCKIKEDALKVANSHIVTIATLTGHAARSVGPYAIAMDNSVARVGHYAERLQKEGFKLADPLEVSKIRREDFAGHKGKCEWDDLHQTAGDKSSVQTARGHQCPAAFLIGASGLDKHELSSEFPLSYTHIDIAGSAGDLPKEPTGAPILALFGKHIRNVNEM